MRLNWRQEPVGMCARFCLILTFVTFAFEKKASAQPTTQAAPSESARIDRLERMLQAVVEENLRLAHELKGLKEQMSAPQAGDVREPIPRSAKSESTLADKSVLPVSGPGAEPIPPQGLQGSLPEDIPFDFDYSAFPTEDSQPEAPDGFGLAESGPVDEGLRSRYGIDYDEGLTIFPEDFEKTPFSLKFNNQNMIRYRGFVRGADFWIDSAGNRRSIANSNSFQIPRGRLIFSGNVFLPQLSYLLNIDYNTVTSNPIGFRAYVLSYEFNRAITLHAGQNKVPGTREWLVSAFSALQGPDRSMATTFFRPSLSQGVWITGEPLERVYYHAMLSNGFNTQNLTPAQLDNRFCWSGSAWWEPLGAFGRSYSDIESHDTPVVRLGGTYTLAGGQGGQNESDAVENSAIRLSDGTLITMPGAFAPDVTLTSYDISLAAVDMAWKYKGLSLSTEWLVQELSGLRGTGPIPIESTRTVGGFVQGGYFVVPEEVELYARTSMVSGRYGSGSEVAGGLNWFILRGRTNLRFGLDAAWLESSPADQNRTGYVAGQTGLLLRSQVVIFY